MLFGNLLCAYFMMQQAYSLVQQTKVKTVTVVGLEKHPRLHRTDQIVHNHRVPNSVLVML